MDAHAKSANALRAKSDGRGQHQIGAVGFEQIRRTDIGLKPFGDQGDHVHQGFGGLAALRRQIADLLQGQDIAIIVRGSRLAHVLNSLVVGGQFGIKGRRGFLGESVGPTPARLRLCFLAGARGFHEAQV